MIYCVDLDKNITQCASHVITELTFEEFEPLLQVMYSDQYLASHNTSFKTLQKNAAFLKLDVDFTSIVRNKYHADDSMPKMAPVEAISTDLKNTVSSS